MFRDESCEGVRRAWFGDAPALRAHARECPDCASWIARRERLESALRGLQRSGAPGTLDGLVVASLHPGYRQDRAVRSLGRLAAESAPAGVTVPVPEHEQGDRAPRAESPESPECEAAMIDSLPRVATPGVLERLVAEALADGARGRVRSAVERLPRQTAPAALDQAVAEALASQSWARESLTPAEAEPGAQARGPRALSWLRRPRAGLWVAAAALVLISGLARVAWTPASEPEAFSFHIRRVTQAGDLSPEARRLVEPLWGSVLPSGAPQSTIPGGGSR